VRFPKLLVATGTLAIFFVLGGPLYAQDRDQERDRLKSSKETTVTGCLVKGDDPGQYTFTDLQSGAKMTATGVDELEKHANNHTVKLTGTSSQDGKSFAVTKVEHVSESCEPRK
jgi:hypothetical protein